MLSILFESEVSQELNGCEESEVVESAVLTDDGESRIQINILFKDADGSTDQRRVGQSSWINLSIIVDKRQRNK